MQNKQHNLVIVGAGLSGLIAARMLADRHPTIIEKQPRLPNNHQAILRFKTESVSLATNIPFQKVKVLKGVHGEDNPIQQAVRYSMKVSGKIEERSVMNTEPSIRWIAPPDLISRLASTAQIEFGVEFEERTNLLFKEQKTDFISTLPVPAAMALFKWDHNINFTSIQGWTARARLRPDISCTMNCTMYFPGGQPWYRVSINGQDIIIEGVGLPLTGEYPWSENYAQTELFRPLGIYYSHLDQEFGIKATSSKYQKIGELSNAEREQVKQFIMWLSKERNVYSLGRFATWRPKLLLDDLVNDVRVIERLMAGQSSYTSQIKA